jgi:hypothetical protein
MLLRSAGFVGIEIVSFSVVVGAGGSGLPGPTVHPRATAPTKRAAAMPPIHHELRRLWKAALLAEVEAGFCWDLVPVGFRFFLARLLFLDMIPPSIIIMSVSSYAEEAGVVANFCPPKTPTVGEVIVAIIHPIGLIGK